MALPHPPGSEPSPQNGVTAAPHRTRARIVLEAVTVLLVAACLRPLITSVGPVLDDIGEDANASEVALGLLGSLPLIAFALVSPFAAGMARRWGAERVVFWSLLVMAAAAAGRMVDAVAAVWTMTALIGAAIAIGNVLVPAIVKHDFPGHTSLATGLYSAVMGCVAAAGAGLAVPLETALGGWRYALGVWAVLPLFVALLWRLHRSGTAVPEPEPRPVSAGRSLWLSPAAWQMTLFFGLQSATFYTMITWLPTIEMAHGRSDHVAGAHLFYYQLVGVVAGLIVTAAMHGRRDQRWPAVLVSLPVAVAAFGFAVAPELSLPWVLLAATGSASSLTVALSLIAQRTADAGQTASLSGMAQSVGYLLAAAGPIAAGLLAGRLDNWSAVLVLVGTLALAQAVIAIWAGRDAPVINHDPSELVTSSHA